MIRNFTWGCKICPLTDLAVGSGWTLGKIYRRVYQQKATWIKGEFCVSFASYVTLLTIDNVEIKFWQQNIANIFTKVYICPLLSLSTFWILTKPNYHVSKQHTLVVFSFWMNQLSWMNHLNKWFKDSLIRTCCHHQQPYQCNLQKESLKNPHPLWIKFKRHN